MNVNVMTVKSSLSQTQLMVLQGEVSKHRKSTGTAYLFLFFLPWIGAHQFYLRNRFKGFMYILGSSAPGYMVVSIYFAGLTANMRGAPTQKFVGAAAIGTGIALLIMIITGLMWFYDLFTLSGQTERANDQIEIDALKVMLPAVKNAS